MKFLSVAALLATAAVASTARAQTSELPMPAISAPTLSTYALDVPAAISTETLSLPDAATLTSGLQLNRTSGNDPSWAKFASGTGNILFLGAGTLLPLVEDGKNGQQHALRTADTLLTSALFSEGLKRLTHKKRPDGSNYESFPSGHATAAFAVATMQANYHPKQAIFWYAGATVIAASRVKLRRHYTVDVLAGAALGYATARLELGQNRGLILRPFIRDAGPANRVTGMSFSKSF